MARDKLIQFRRNTASAATSSNPVLAAGEPGFESDTGVVKIGDGVTAWTSLPPALSGTYARVVGLANPTGGSDDSALFTTAEAALPANGGIVWMPPGTYKLPNGYAFTKRVTLIGAGAGQYESQSTRIEVSSTTANGLTFGAHGSAVRDVALINTSAGASAGAGLYFTAGQWARIDRVQVTAFYNNIYVAEGFYYTISDSMILNPKNYGIYLTNATAGEFDHGDATIEGCTISKFGDTSNGGTAVRWESGGGLRFVNNKINGGTQPGYTSTGKFAHGLMAKVADGGSTSVLVITGNSIENCTANAVTVSQLGTTGLFSKIVCTGNEIALSGYGFWIDCAVSQDGKVSDAIVSDNVFTDLSGASVDIFNGPTGVTVGPNHHVRCASIVKVDGATATNVAIAKQTVVGDNLVLLFNNAVGVTLQGPFADCRADYDREIPSTTSSVTYTALWNLIMPQNSGGILDLTLGGYVTGVGAFCVQAKRAWTKATGAVTLTTVGTDVAVGTVVDYAFDTTTVSGQVLVKLRINAGAGGTNITGRANLVVNGPIYTVRKGT